MRGVSKSISSAEYIKGAVARKVMKSHPFIVNNSRENGNKTLRSSVNCKVMSLPNGVKCLYER